MDWFRNRRGEKQYVCSRRCQSVHLLPSNATDSVRSQSEREAKQHAHAIFSAAHRFSLINKPLVGLFTGENLTFNHVGRNLLGLEFGAACRAFCLTLQRAKERFDPRGEQQLILGRNRHRLYAGLSGLERRCGPPPRDRPITPLSYNLIGAVHVFLRIGGKSAANAVAMPKACAMPTRVPVISRGSVALLS
jgi:hypothetical protein